MARVKVRVLAEQLTYTNPEGPAGNYFRGDVLEMEEAHAISAAEGCDPRLSPKPQGVARASVEILKEDAPISAPGQGPPLDPAQIAMDQEIAKNRAKGERLAAQERAADRSRMLKDDKR